MINTRRYEGRTTDNTQVVQKKQVILQTTYTTDTIRNFIL